MNKIKTIINYEQLLEAVAMGYTFKYIYFWGHRKTSEVTKSCFSQWYPAPFTIDGIVYPTAEHYMMAEKARLFGDEEMLEKILMTDCPKKAKAYGRAVKGFDYQVWNAECFDIVVRGNMAKFSQNEEMGAFLKTTGNRVIVEASPFDKVWGVGMSQDAKNIGDPRMWKGANLLGFALMKVRGEMS